MAVANPLSISKQPFFGRLFAHSVEFKATVMWLTGTALLVIGLVVFANSFAAEGEVEDWFDPAAVPPIVFAAAGGAAHATAAGVAGARAGDRAGDRRRAAVGHQGRGPGQAGCLRLRPPGAERRQ